MYILLIYNMQYNMLKTRIVHQWNQFERFKAHADFKNFDHDQYYKKHSTFMNS